MTSREDDEVAQAPATWENEVVGEAKEALGRLTRDDALVEEGEQQVEAAREVREEFQKEREHRDER